MAWWPDYGTWPIWAGSWPGWCSRALVAVVRPDKVVLHDGPTRKGNQILRESLALL